MLWHLLAFVTFEDFTFTESLEAFVELPRVGAHRPAAEVREPRGGDSLIGAELDSDIKDEVGFGDTVRSVMGWADCCGMAAGDCD